MKNTKKKLLFSVYLEKRPALRRFLIARFRDDAFADDVLQEIYLKIESAQLGGTIHNESAFLYKVANNLALDLRKKNVRRNGRDQSWADTEQQLIGGQAIYDAVDADKAIDAREQIKKLNHLITKLPPQCAKVFVAHKIDGLSHKEVAAKLQISKSTVEKHMSKALKILALQMALGK